MSSNGDDAGSTPGLRGLEIDGNAREVLLNGELVDLTRVEFDLLSLLHDNPRVVISSDDISRTVLGSEWFTGAHTIAVHISHIRTKLGPTASKYIVTKRGVGYMFDSRLELPEASNSDRRSVELIYDGQLILIAVDPADEPFFGWIPDEVLGTNHLIGVPAAMRDNQAGIIDHMVGMARNGIPKFSSANIVECADGTMVPGQIDFEVLLNPDGDLHQVSCYFTED